MVRIQTAGAAAAAAAALTIGGVSFVNPIFGVLENTADELADLLGVSEVPPVAAQAVRALKPVYAPLKAASPSCTSALFPEFNDLLDMNDCLLLPSRVFWSSNKAPITIKQTMSSGSMWQVSTGSTVWGGGVVLQRYVESLGPEFWQGKRVIELGTGTGLGGVAAARLGASHVLVTDRDAAVLKLADANARANLDSAAYAGFATSLLEWGPVPTDGSAVEAAYTQKWDVVIGADLTYNREAWPVLVQTIQRLQAPVILSASERRPNELASLQDFFTSNGLKFEMLASPMSEGYAASNIKVFRISRPDAPAPAPAPAAIRTTAGSSGGAGGGSGSGTTPLPSQSAAQMVAAPPDGAAGGAQAPPSAKELAGALLREAFNTPGAPAWYEVDAQLKAERLEWAYGAVRARGYDPQKPPKPPESLRRASTPLSAPTTQSKFGEAL